MAERQVWSIEMWERRKARGKPYLHYGEGDRTYLPVLGRGGDVAEEAAMAVGSRLGRNRAARDQEVRLLLPS